MIAARVGGHRPDMGLPYFARPVAGSPRFVGGFIFLEIGASIVCAGAVIRGNVAGDQGGSFYARKAKLVQSSCDIVANESPRGATISLSSVKSATFENHTITGNLVSSSGVLDVLSSAVL